MPFLVVLFHIFSNILFGSSLIHLVSKKRELSFYFLVESFLAGAFIETLIGFLFSWLGINEVYSFYLLFAVGLIYALCSFFILKRKPKLSKVSFPKLHLLEWFLVVPLLVKVSILFYQILKFPLYFDDALTLWSGRAHALFGKVNWSMDPSSPFFLGHQYGFKEYPFFLVYWRSISAGIYGEWNDLIAKMDSFIFYVCILIVCFHIVKTLTQKRWLAIAVAFVVSALPLMQTHSIAGYSEIALSLIMLLIFFALTKKEYVKAGLFTALAIWTKNEGLFIFWPTFATALIVLLYFTKSLDLKGKLMAFLKYNLASLGFILPYFLFKILNGVNFSIALKAENYYHEESLGLFFDMIFTNQSSNIFWIVFFIFIVTGIPKYKKDKNTIFAVLTILIVFCLLLYVFCFTGAHMYLVNQMTPHRSLLQIAPLAAVVIALIAKSKQSKQSQVI